MKTSTPRHRFALLVTILLCAATSAFAQWQQVANIDAGASAKMISHGSAVFLYGFQGSIKFYRTTNDGTSWTDISSSAVERFNDIFSFNGTLYATYLNRVYTSTNLGQNWTLLSTLTVTGNGALNGLASDGTTLFAFSTRKSVFRSTNSGATWTELLINDPNISNIIDFAARGNRYAAVVANSGAWISEDAGVTWTLRNPTTGLSGIYGFGTALLGMSFGGGMFTMQNGSSSWVAANSGLPDNGSFVIPKAPASQGNTVYFGFQQLITNFAGVARSTDAGVTWTVLDTAGMPAMNPAVSNRTVAVTPTHVYYYYNTFPANSRLGVYRTAGLPAAVREVASGIPAEFLLEQNYPNPFNPTTVIRFSVPSGTANADVRLRVYDLLGKEVAELVNERLGSGNYETTFSAKGGSASGGDGKGFSSGMYFYKLETGTTTLTKRMMMVK